MHIFSIKNLFLLALSGGFLTAGGVILFYISQPLPTVDLLGNVYSNQSIVLTDRNGEFLFNFSEDEHRTTVAYQDISDTIIDATLAVEDHKFFEHHGIRLDAFFRALIHNITTRSFGQGGSTITQQLVKNVFLGGEKKIERKIKEFILAPKIEAQYSKEDILELYLNTIPYGGVIYGIAEASNVFFNKKPSEVTIAEAAYLAAIPNAPTYFSPYGKNKPELEKRKNAVLELMLQNEFITRAEYNEAKNENVYFQPQDVFSINAPHFVFMVKEDLEKQYGVSLRAFNGEIIQTTIDIELQQTIEKLATEYSKGLEKRFGAKNIAAVVLSAETGEILSLVGSKDFFDSSIDGSVNITTSLRQPGSTFKPFAYATAFERGYSPNTILYDVQTQFGVLCDEDLFETNNESEDFCYSPVNYTDRFTGPISMRNALAQSINIPAVKTLYLAGVQNTIRTAQAFGISSLQEGSHHYGLSLVLGGAEVTPLELAQAYNVFANGGKFVAARWSNDTRFHTHTATKDGERVLSERSAGYITNILSDNAARTPVFGANSALNITAPVVAAKTGTTNNSRDIWVAGYSPDIVVLVWAGNSDSELLENNAAGASLGVLFRDIMLAATDKYGSRTAAFEKEFVPDYFDAADIINGVLDKDNLHTILHFIQKDDVTKTPDDPDEQDQQYSHWEFAVQKWLEDNELPETLFEQEQTFSTQHLTIQHPTKGSVLDYNNPIAILVNPLNYPGVRYEFYANGVLIDATHLPTINLLPQNVVQKRDTLHLQVIANTPEGVFLAEEFYSFAD